MDQQEAWAVVMDNERLVRKTVSDFCEKHSGRNFDDLYSAGMIGALKGVQNFDPAKGRLSTNIYVNVWWTLTEEWRRYERQTGVFVYENNDSSKARKRRVERREFLSDSRRTSLAEDEAQEFFELLVIDPGFEDESVDRLDVIELLSCLDEAEEEIIRLRFWSGLKIADIAEQKALTKSRIYQIQASAFEKLRAKLTGAAA